MDHADGRTRRAISLLDRQGPAFRRTATRFSICPDDADDALQRASLALLEKAPPHPPARLTAWMHVVTRREALALRRERERLLGSEVPWSLECSAPRPPERALRRERSLEQIRALARLKADERQALLLRGQGYSYAEISRMTGWSLTKVNRCLAEGRARLRQLGAMG